ncbi:MAG: aminotransferase class III-fold pyridoxal phosphate-dependent enzyme [Chloroflexales bacterium]|nr:aminotransferase class III-fold pyridoxal phosphate-dependent enzyme [Chloroflexales bacterium]
MLEELYRARFARSAQLATEAADRFPGGVTHDGRAATPFPLFITRAAGARKWDVDDNLMIDYWCGHGALLLGHGHPAVIAAVQAQLERGTHMGGESPLALRWAELVQSLVPGAERVRFTSSGTESTMLALRLVRAFTGRPKIIRFLGHFHGWHDMAAPGADPEDPNAGLPAELLGNILTLPTDLDIVADTLARAGDVAAVILEPTGASFGTVPLSDSFLRGLRSLTEDHGVLLICDEVVTGFRVSPGGAAARAGVVADLTCLAKILAGGLPGGAVVGREASMRRLAAGEEAGDSRGRIRHQGTYNANPLSAAAGVVCLEMVAAGAPATAAERGRELADAFNRVLMAREARGFTAYGDGSIVHIFADPAVAVEPGQAPTGLTVAALKRGGDPRVVNALRMAVQLAGADLMRGRSAFVSAAHTSDDVAATAVALDDALGMLQAEGIIER